MLDRIRRAYSFVPPDYRRAIGAATTAVFLAGLVFGAVAAIAIVLWLAPGAAPIMPPAAPATDKAVEDHKRDLAASGAEDKATAATEAATSKTSRARARSIHRERQVTHDTDMEIVDAVRRAPDAEQPRLFREQLARARASLDELDRADRERARRRAERAGGGTDLDAGRTSPDE